MGRGRIFASIVVGMSLASGSGCSRKGPPPPKEFSVRVLQGSITSFSFDHIPLNTSDSCHDGLDGHLHGAIPVEGVGLLRSRITSASNHLAGEIAFLTRPDAAPGTYVLEFAGCVSGFRERTGSRAVASHPFQLRLTVVPADTRELWTALEGTWLQARYGIGDDGFSVGERKWRDGTGCARTGNEKEFSAPVRFDIVRETDHVAGVEFVPNGSNRPAVLPRLDSSRCAAQDASFPTPIYSIEYAIESAGRWFLRLRGAGEGVDASYVRIEPMEESFPEEMVRAVEDPKSSYHVAAVFAAGPVWSEGVEDRAHPRSNARDPLTRRQLRAEALDPGSPRDARGRPAAMTLRTAMGHWPQPACAADALAAPARRRPGRHDSSCPPDTP